MRKTTILKDGSAKNELSFLPTTDEIERMDSQRKAKMCAKIKLRTEKEIVNSKKTVGSYIYDTLLQKRSTCESCSNFQLFICVNIPQLR